MCVKFKLTSRNCVPHDPLSVEFFFDDLLQDRLVRWCPFQPLRPRDRSALKHPETPLWHL